MDWRCRLAATLLLLCVASRAYAAEPVIEFLRAAQDQGYGEVSLDYLEQLQSTGKLPKSLKETIDLELSRSYRLAAAEAFNATEAEQRLAKAKTHLDKFLKEYPEHPEVARAIESWGDLSLDQAREQIRQAAAVKDPSVKEKHLTAARAALDDARSRLIDATARYLARYTKLKPGTPENGKRAKGGTTGKKQRASEEAARDAEIDWLECRFKLAKLDFYAAETYLDPRATPRLNALGAAAKAFDDIFQAYRESMVGLHAHLWHGRVADAQGNDQLALDIYDEVLSVAPEGRERETGLEPLFAQVQYHRLLVVARKDGPEVFLKQANDWLQQHRTWKKFDAYQGVALEVAKANLKIAATLSGQKKTALMQPTLAMLADIGKTRGEFQQAAILLRREATKGAMEAKDLSTVKTFDEALALGEQAYEAQDWANAIDAFDRALEIGPPNKDAKRIAAAQSRVDQARYRMAATAYEVGQFDECLAALEQIARERPDSAIAAPAASLAVSAALSLYVKASDKPAALARLEALAQNVISRWPDKAEADEARIALGQASLARHELPQAIEIFERVNPRSQRYPAALFLAGQTHWRRYLAAKPKATTPEAKKPLAEERAKAEEQIRASLQALTKSAEPGRPPGRSLIEAQLLLGEMCLEANQPKEAAQLIEPLVQAVVAAKPNPMDNLDLRGFLAIARARVALDQYQQAVTAGRTLADIGPDDHAVNAVLYSIFRLACDPWKQNLADIIEARTAADTAAVTKAEAAAATKKEFLAQFVTQLTTRRQYTLPAMIAIADTAAQLDLPERARDLYQSILAQANSDPAFKKANEQAVTRIQAQLVGLLRRQREFSEALNQVNSLIAAYPNALEPLMEKGRVLQGWSEVDPSHFNEAVAHWTMLRTRLAKTAKKPPEYYEIVYNTATCLVQDSVKTDNKQKALQAEQLLNATLVLSPNLNGPEMVAQYKDLMQKARQLRK